MEGIHWPDDGKSAVLLFLAASGAVLVANVVYSLVVHPLSSVPGPRLCAITRFPYWIRVFRGRDVQYLHQLHERYGPVVRYGPNDLSFSSAQSWRDIHGHSKGRPAPPKAGDFGMMPANGTSLGDDGFILTTMLTFSQAFRAFSCVMTRTMPACGASLLLLLQIVLYVSRSPRLRNSK